MSMENEYISELDSGTLLRCFIVLQGVSTFFASKMVLAREAVWQFSITH